MADKEKRERPDGTISPILKKVLDRRDEMGVTNYWIAKRANGSIPGVYNFLRGKADPNLRTLQSVLGLVGLEISLTEGFKPVE